MYGVLTEDGDEVVIGKGIGGGTKLYGGLVGPVDFDMWHKYGIDLEPYHESAMKETWVTEEPYDFTGLQGKRLDAACAKHGIHMKTMKKHINYKYCKIGCNLCTFGCKRGAKWEGRYALKDAEAYGAKILIKTKVERAIIENGRAVGFRATRKNSPIEVRANAVVCSCGGWGSVPIAKRAGLEKAGTWFTGDPCVYQFGFTKKRGVKDKRSSMGSSYFNDLDRGCLFLGGEPPSFLLWMVMYLQQEGISAVKDVCRHNKLLATGFKIHDDDKGYIKDDGSMIKIYTPQDKDRLEDVSNTCRDILISAGCDPNDIHTSNILLGHPSGTIPIGKLLTEYCESMDIPNLYFCDASALPEAPGVPPHPKSGVSRQVFCQPFVDKGPLRQRPTK